MLKMKHNRKDLKMKNKNSKISSTIIAMTVSANISAMVYSIYLVFAITI